MTDREIFQKVIEKILAKGWLPEEIWKAYPQNEKELRGTGKTNKHLMEVVKLSISNWLKEKMLAIVFSHDFAKAFWGEEKVCIFCGHELSTDYYCKKHNGRYFNKTDKCEICNKQVEFWSEWCSGCDEFTKNKREPFKQIKIPTWQYHLQQMVLEKEPLNYLEKFL